MQIFISQPNLNGQNNTAFQAEKKRIKDEEKEKKRLEKERKQKEKEDRAKKRGMKNFSIKKSEKSSLSAVSSGNTLLVTRAVAAAQN